MISIVVPTVPGREEFYERCVKAYREHTLGEYEIITEYDHPSCGLAWQAGAEKCRGEYIHLTADDIEPRPGWHVPAEEAVRFGFIPAPQVYDPSGMPQSHPLPGVVSIDWASVHMSALPFCSRYQWEKIAPLMTCHYYCVVPETPVLTAGLEWMPAGKLGLGDEIVGIDEFPESYGDRRYRRAVVTGASRRVMECLTLRMEDGREVVCSLAHRWLVKTQRRPAISNGKQTTLTWMEASRLRPGDKISSPLRVWDAETSFEAGWLSGIFDGEGSAGRYTSGARSHRRTSLSVAQNPGPVLDRIKAGLDVMGVRYTERPNASGSRVTKLQVCSIADVMEVLGRLAPVRLRSAGLWEGTSIRTKAPNQYAAVTEIAPAGMREVVALGTSTGTFLANGMTSHNTDDFFSWRAARAGWRSCLRTGYSFTHWWAQHRRGAGMSEPDRMRHDAGLYQEARRRVEAGQWTEPWPAAGR